MRKPKPPEEIEGFRRGDACKWGPGDWYDDKRELLLKAIEAKKAFDTGWYGCKKEILSGRIHTDGLGNYECSVSVSDDFDTEGIGRVIITSHAKPEKVLDRLHDALNEAWDLAGKDQKANQVYTGFSIHAPRRTHSAYVGGKPVGKSSICNMWVETYIRNDNGWLDQPPGDNYHKWGFQGECSIPAKVKEQLEDWACSWREGQAEKSFTVGKWTIKPWEE